MKARDLGVAQAAIYWYSPTKDHLFVAAVERILHDVLARKPRRGPIVERVLWFADRLSEMQELRLAMRDRARVSEVVAAFEADVSALLRTLLVGALDGGVAGPAVDDAADSVMALCEGVLLRRAGRRRRRELIRFGFDRLVGGGDE